MESSVNVRAQTLKEHSSALEELKNTLRAKTGYHIRNFAHRKAVEQFTPVALNLERCRPIPIRLLERGAINKGALLKGRLITEAIKMQSVQSVLEDAAGDVVTVHIYNVPCLPATSTTMADLEAAQRLFPVGQDLIIIEPFYKVMMDGTSGVRVDNPAEVIFLDAEGKPLKSAAELSTNYGTTGSSSSSSSSSQAGAAATVGWNRPLMTDPSGIGRVVKPQRPNKRKKNSKDKGN